MKAIKILLILISPILLNAQNFTPNDVPDNKTQFNQNLYDGTSKLLEREKEEMNKYLLYLEDSLGYQVAVVMLNSIGDYGNAHKFGLDLFNLWGIGNDSLNNGLLILVVLDIRRTEFITGTGLESVLPDSRCYQIQQKKMNPEFKNGNFFEGIMAGLKTVEKIYLGQPVSELDATTDNATPHDGAWEEERGDSFYHFFIIYLYSCVGAFGFALLMLLISFIPKQLTTRYNWIKVADLGIFKILFPIPFLLMIPLLRWMKNNVRYRTRYSPTTGAELHLLEENEEDDFLTKVQIAKEKIGSYDFDVWISEDMEEFVIIPYKKWFMHVSKCPKCKERTYQMISNQIISSATYSSSGSGIKTYKCHACNHKKTRRYTIPRKTRSTSSSSSYSSSSSSSWSNSSSSGGSWGGGSSSGGGAGSSW